MKLIAGKALVVVLSFLPVNSYAIPTYLVGMSMENTIAVNSHININATIVNTGSEAIVFDTNFTDTIEDGYGIQFGLSGGLLDSTHEFRFGRSQDISLDYSQPSLFSEFEGVTIEAGKAFNFVWGNFKAPETEGYFLDNIVSFMIGAGSEYEGPEHLTFTTGYPAYSEPMTWFSQGISMKTAYPVSEPSSLALMIASFAVVGFLRRRTHTAI